MAEAFQQDKTEKATPHRRELARKEGQIAKSREVISSALFISAIIFFTFSGSNLFKEMASLTHQILGTLEQIRVSQSDIHVLLTYLWRRVFQMLLPFLSTLFAIALLFNLFQTGFLFSIKPLQPKLSHLNPLKGLGKVFSIQSLHELFKSLFKILVVGYVIYMTLRDEYLKTHVLSSLNVSGILHYIGLSGLRLCFRASLAMAVLAIIDFAFQRWNYAKQLRMSKQEVKDESKQEQGDPLLRSRVRTLMHEMAQKRMMEDVPQADVIITNPTHLAIALLYRRDDMPAPKVIAKGAGYLADRIKEIAKVNRIPIIENKSVARNLFKHVEIGDIIPETLYQAVAEILSYVYQISPRAQV